MEQIKKFLHGKGFALVLAACLLAAAAAGAVSYTHLTLPTKRIV